MDRCVFSVLLAITVLITGCAGKLAQPVQITSAPVAPAGMQRFEGISDERCTSEWTAYEQAWARAMERAGQFVATHLRSEILEWNQQTTQATLGQRLVNVKTLFESTTEAKTLVTLREVYEVEQRREHYADGTWKARVILLAPTDQLLADAQEAEAQLRLELAQAEEDAKHTLCVLHNRVRDQMQQAQDALHLPEKLALLEGGLQSHRQFEEAQEDRQAAQQAVASHEGVRALALYGGIPTFPDKCITDHASGPLPDVPHRYEQTWQAIIEAGHTLVSAEEALQIHKLTSAASLLNSFQQRMGNVTGPFRHAHTGETFSFPHPPGQLLARLQTLQESAQQASQRAEQASHQGDILALLQAQYVAANANVENSQAAQLLEASLQRIGNARLVAEPSELVLPYRVSTDTELQVSLMADEGQSIAMPIQFRFQEEGVDATLETDRTNVVSSTGYLLIQRLDRMPENITKLHLLATPASQALSGLDEDLHRRLEAALDGHVLVIPVTVLPTRQSLELALSLTSDSLGKEQLALFQREMIDGLRTKEYTITQAPEISGLHIRGQLHLTSAPVGSLVTLNLAATLAFWQGKHPIVENIRLSSGPHVAPSQQEALTVAQRNLIRKCIAEVEKQVQRLMVIDE